MKKVTCKKCNEEVDEDFFYKNKRRRLSGKVEWEYRPECKNCTRLNLSIKRSMQKAKEKHLQKIEKRKQKENDLPNA